MAGVLVEINVHGLTFSMCLARAMLYKQNIYWKLNFIKSTFGSLLDLPHTSYILEETFARISYVAVDICNIYVATAFTVDYYL